LYLYFVILPPEKSFVGCWWICIVKVVSNSTSGWLKARIVTKVYIQIFFRLDYGDIFSLAAKMTSIKLFLAMATLERCPSISWMSKLSSYMVICWRKLYRTTSWFCCSRGFLVVYVISIDLYMVLNNLLRHGLVY